MATGSILLPIRSDRTPVYWRLRKTAEKHGLTSGPWSAARNINSRAAVPGPASHRATASVKYFTGMFLFPIEDFSVSQINLICESSYNEASLMWFSSLHSLHNPIVYLNWVDWVPGALHGCEGTQTYLSNTGRVLTAPHLVHKPMGDARFSFLS